MPEIIFDDVPVGCTFTVLPIDKTRWVHDPKVYRKVSALRAEHLGKTYWPGNFSGYLCTVRGRFE